MTKIFIHCGAPKTGTSFLQVLFARYAEDLEAGGIIYPENSYSALAKAGKITSGNGIEMANFLNPNLPHIIADKEAFPEDLKRTITEAAGKSLLYSSEFIMFADSERSKRLAKVISDAGYTPQVLYCIRDIGRAATSSYSQAVKRHGETRSFRDFVKSSGSEIPVEYSMPNQNIWARKYFSFQLRRTQEPSC